MAAGRWKTAPDAWSVRQLRAEIREFAERHGFEEERAQDLTLAVSEIISNAVLHAYRDGSDGTIEIGADVTDGHLEVWIVDTGVGMSPRPDSPGAGLGLMIAGSIADRMHIERPPHGGTTVSMAFACAA